MTYELEITVAPFAIERAVAVFENFKATGSRPARPDTQGALTDHISVNWRRARPTNRSLSCPGRRT